MNRPQTLEGAQVWDLVGRLGGHGETPEEREDARILLVVLDAKTPGRVERHRPDPEPRR